MIVLAVLFSLSKRGTVHLSLIACPNNGMTSLFFCSFHSRLQCVAGGVWPSISASGVCVQGAACMFAI